MTWINNLTLREQEAVRQCRVHKPHRHNINAISFLYEINSNLAVDIIVKLAALLDEIESGKWDALETEAYGETLE